MGWTQVVTALSVAILAVVVVGMGFVVLLMLRDVRRLLESAERAVRTLGHDARPVIDSARQVLKDTETIVGKVRGEIDGLTATSRDVRERVDRLTEAVEDRLLDVEALVDVVYEEVEDTALDIAAALRTTRRGMSVMGAMKRAFLGRSR
jgi:uncharacterized protein YoxC